jgi:hypothetical protein
VTIPPWPDLPAAELRDIAEGARVTDPREPGPSPAADRRVTLPSLLAPGRQVTVDPYGRNPLADEARQLFPGLAALAAAALPAPRMFTDGTEDVPIFTASGVNPEMLLLRLPYRVRHAAAAEPSMDLVLGDLFPRYAGNPYAHLEHLGLTNAVDRVRAWLEHAAQTHETLRERS